MKKMCKNSVGLVLGLFFALVHLVWAILAAAGAVKPLMDWVLSMHMVQFDFGVLAFDLGKSAMLVVMTFVCGYVCGWVFSAIWNLLRKD
ncbi:hypothetical protein HY932_01505 [Candidatus Falkowbacteria bacterium]|nr:hypothetical protein [Candidatus Falkowbacteria bacterium]